MSWRVTLLTGGSTPERDVALAGAAQVAVALRTRGHHVTVVDTVSGPVVGDAEIRLLSRPVGAAPPSKEDLQRLRAAELGPRIAELPEITHADVVFIVLHGSEAEGGLTQALLDSADVPYTGSGLLGSALAMDKDMAKRLFRAAGIPTPDWQVWPASDGAVARLGLPLIVKPSRVGSTVGLTVVENTSAVPEAVAFASAYDQHVLLEQYVDGPEYTVGVLDDSALAVGEIRPSHAIFDYECKYTPGMCEEIFPAQIDPGLTVRIQEFGVAAHRALKLRDYSRIDFRADRDGTLYCLEANTLPGLTRTSLLPQSAAAAGIPFDELCERICRAAIGRGATGTSSGSG